MKRRQRRKRTSWADAHRRVLRNGYSFIGNADGFVTPDGKPNLAVMQQAWRDLRDEIMAVWNTPGRRPNAWWRFESPEPRDMSKCQAQQLDDLGLLSEDELAALAAQAKAKNEQRHRNPYSAGSDPFRRPWLFWRFVHQRRPEISEAKQIVDDNLMDDLEKAVLANPQGAMAGRVVPTRSRFHYLDDDEQKLTGLIHPQNFADRSA